MCRCSRSTTCGRGFSSAQLDAVKGHLPAALQGVVEFGYLTGWRLSSEVLPLEWRQVDWPGRVVRLDPGTTKNDDGRSFPFTAAIEALLQVQDAEHERLKQAGRLVPYVFHRKGKRIRNLYGAWLTALSKNPIDAKAESLFGRGLGHWIGRQAADDDRLW